MLNNFKEWLSDYLRYILLGLAVILVVAIVALAVRFVKGLGTDTPGETEPESQTETELIVQTEPETETESETEEPNDLEENADESVTAFVERYLNAVVEGDTDTLKGMTETFTDEDAQSIADIAEYTESYNNITCYTKKGITEDSYVAFMYYEAKYYNIETPSPSVRYFYVDTKEDGEFTIIDRSSNSEVDAYLTELIKDEDVQALSADVQKKHEDALEADEDLKSFFDNITDTSSDNEEDDSTADADASVDKIVTAATTCNIRSDSRPDAELLGVLEEGETITRMRLLDNGWAEVRYQDRTAYVLAEYLTD